MRLVFHELFDASNYVDLFVHDLANMNSRYSFQYISFIYSFLKFQDEVEKCKTTYEALNSQLIEELPTLIDAAMSIFMNVISEFVVGRKVLVGRITKELLSLMDVSDFNNLEKMLDKSS